VEANDYLIAYEWGISISEYYNQDEEVICKMKEFLHARAKGEKRYQDRQEAQAKSKR
jgi:hypothetical protein